MGKAISSQHDERVVTALHRLEPWIYLATAAIAAVVLILWAMPPLRPLAPAGWSRMTGLTATGVALSVLSLAVSGRSPAAGEPQRQMSQAAAMLVLLLGLTAIAEHLLHQSWRINAWLSPGLDRFAARPSLQSAIGFVLIGISLLTVHQYRNWLSRCADLAAVGLIAFLLVLIGGYLFDATAIIGTGEHGLISPQTLLCFALLTFLVGLRRAQHGQVLAVLVDAGIGSRIVRAVLPVAVALPFGFFAAVTYLSHRLPQSPEYVTASAAAAEALLIFCFIVWMAWRINDLERRLRGLSLMDELTQVNNRRGFSLLAGQALREAIRSRAWVTVFYFDLDGLKRANDTAGHDAGSRMIREMARILSTTFRESDIVGRLGGDEFAVWMSGRRNSVPDVLDRVDRAVGDYNASRANPCELGYSVGSAERLASDDMSVAELVDAADLEMLRQKRSKQAPP